MTTQAHYIREWRKKRGLTQAALAQAMNMDRSLITKVELGSHRYNQDILEGAAKVLNCSTADLLLRHPDDPQGLWAEYDLLTVEQRRMLVEFARTLRRQA